MLNIIEPSYAINSCRANSFTNSSNFADKFSNIEYRQHIQSSYTGHESSNYPYTTHQTQQSYISNDNEKFNHMLISNYGSNLAYNQQHTQAINSNSYFQQQHQFPSLNSNQGFAVNNDNEFKSHLEITDNTFCYPKIHSKPETPVTNHLNSNYSASLPYLDKKANKSETSEYIYNASKNDAKINKAFGLKPKEKSEKSVKPGNNYCGSREDTYSDDSEFRNGATLRERNRTFFLTYFFS